MKNHISNIHAKVGGFWHDLFSIAGRALRAIPKEPEYMIPAVIIPLFFFAVNVGSLSNISSFAGIENFNAFQLPVAIIFAVTGISRAVALVNDISSGYFDRLLVSPVNRLALLLGLMVADFLLIIALCVPVLILGFILGVKFASGILGILVFLLISGLWGLAFTGIPYYIALRTGSPAAVNASFILFFPFAFMTTTFMPLEALSGWMRTGATYNPVTYVLEGLRSLIIEGWVMHDLLWAFGCIFVLGFLSIGAALIALKQRVKRN